jgi:hypothetical protein
MDIYPPDEDESSIAQSVSAPMRASSLASAVGKVGNKTAQNSVIHQPAKDMGKIQPTVAPAALPAPTMKTGMQIPKQKSQVPVSQKDADDDKEFEKLSESVRKITASRL